jgi:uncharacterized protein (UPF0261 family)
VPDGPFWNPEADAAFLQTLRSELRSDFEILTFEHHVNDPAFGVEVAGLFVDVMKQHSE